MTLDPQPLFTQWRCCGPDCTHAVLVFNADAARLARESTTEGWLIVGPLRFHEQRCFARWIVVHAGDLLPTPDA